MIYRQMEMIVDTLTSDELYALILDYPTLSINNGNEEVCAPGRVNSTLKNVTATPR